MCPLFRDFIVCEKCEYPCRCESFNGLMRLQNLHSNRHASSYDIAVRFSHIEHIRHLLHGGNPKYTIIIIYSRTKLSSYVLYSCAVGDGLIDLAKKKEVRDFVFCKTKMLTKAIYQTGALRKVVIN